MYLYVEKGNNCTVEARTAIEHHQLPDMVFFINCKIVKMWNNYFGFLQHMSQRTSQTPNKKKIISHC